MKRHVDEEGFLLAWQPYLERLTRAEGRGLDPEDRMALARLKLPEAARSYRVGAVGDFAAFAGGIIRKELAAARVAANHVRSQERHSLDAPLLPDEPKLLPGRYLGCVQDCQDYICFRDFIDHLPKATRATAWLLVKRYTPAEIMWKQALSPAVYAGHLRRIADAWLAYQRACEA